VLASTKVGRRYRTTVPREVRKSLGINENDGIERVFVDNEVIVRKKGGKKIKYSLYNQNVFSWV